MDGLLDRFDVPEFDVPHVEVVVAFMLTGHDRCVAMFYFVFLHVLFRVGCAAPKCAAGLIGILFA